MKILFAASEAYPYAKTGGLADVATALTNELIQLGQDVKLILPGYPQLVEKLAVTRQSSLEFHIGKLLKYTLNIGRLPGSAAEVILVRSDRIYESQELYGGSRFQQFLKFFTLSHAAANIAAHPYILSWKPDVLHANDWHTGLAFQIMDSFDENTIAKVFSIHNIAFSGRFPFSYLRNANHILDGFKGALFADDEEFSFLEEAIAHADKIITVSPNYAREIQGEQFGFGFEQLLASRKRDVTGILNGVDYNIWHPEQDPYLACNNHRFSKIEKRDSKRRVQHQYGLPIDDDALLCSFTNRLTHQKMIDVIITALDTFPTNGLQFVFHGNGEAVYQDALKRLSEKTNVSYIEGFQERIEHQLLAGADICLTPSRFEPCGLNALYALRYGALPLARNIGGYCDTIADEFASATKGAGNGFFMPAQSPDAFIHSLKRIKTIYRDNSYWAKLVENAKSKHFSWGDTARQYLSLYTLATRKRMSVRDIRSEALTTRERQTHSLAS